MNRTTRAQRINKRYDAIWEHYDKQRNEHFTCDCNSGATRILSADRVEHKCGFRPSANYGTLGSWVPYRRVQINGTDRFNWFVDYQSTPKVQV